MTELGRFAPTPSGRMHLGNIFSAMLAWLSARSIGAEMLLRIEDLDTLRCPQENTDILKADLHWLGLEWDREQPQQSTRSEYYKSVLDQLKNRSHIYPCWCTRGDLKHVPNAPHASDGHPIYPGTCRNLNSDQQREKIALRAPLWRIRVPETKICFTDGHMGFYSEQLNSECGDFILRRADGVFAYQLAVVADDIAAGVTQVVRGADLLSSTPRQLYLYQLLEADAPQYYHLPLLTAPDGRRLSKRDADLDIGLLKERYYPEEIWGILGYTAGLLPEPSPCKFMDLIPLFSWKNIPLHDIALKLPSTADFP